MNKNIIPEYLTLKKIALLSLIISLSFHMIMVLAIFFGDTLFFDEKTRDFPHYNFNIWRSLLFTGIHFIMIFIILIYHQIVMIHSIKNKIVELILTILGSLLIATVLSIGFVFTSEAIRPEPSDPEFLYNVIMDKLIRDLTLTVMTLLVVQLLKSQYNQKKIAVENESLRSQNILTRFEALKNRLDPHFIFNSLNTLQSLISLDTEKAEIYLQELSSVLRYTLQNKEIVSLKEEMKCVYAYCELMQIRYGENLRFDFNINTKYNNFSVLPLSLQSLIENSVKHNVISSKQPLTVTIATGDGCISVSNPIQEKTSHEESNGIGLANLTERYRLKWNKTVEINHDGSIFCVKIPLVQNN